MTNIGAARTIVEPHSSQNTSDRRVHPRLSPDELIIPASIAIHNRPAISLVDLSKGGARIDLPFQVSPNALVTVEFRAASERIMLPFRLLRCYVTSLKGGMFYQAAGAFEKELDWKPLLTGGSAEETSNRLIATLDAFMRQGAAPAGQFEFNQLLIWTLDAARRGEGAERIAREIRLRITRLMPKIVIESATRPHVPDPTKCARFFGFDFTSEHVLSTPDRRLLRTAAQLLSIVSRSGHSLDVFAAARLRDVDTAKVRAPR